MWIAHNWNQLQKKENDAFRVPLAIEKIGPVN